MKLCVIIGAGPQMGVSIAHRFAREGYSIALISRSADNLVSDLRQLEHMRDFDVHAFPADVSDPESLQNAFTNIENQLKMPDVLVYNAAGYADGQPSTVKPDDLIATLKINVIGAVIASQWALASMKTEQSGTMLFTGGGLSINPRPEYTALALGKAALRNFVGSLAKELSEEGIKVGTVTIAGYVHKTDGFDPDKIAEKYWQLNSSAPSTDDYEIVYSGE